MILLALFVDIGGDHARRKASGEVAFFAALPENYHGDVGIPARRDAHEPGVVVDGVGMAEFGGEGVAHRLGAAGFSGEVDPLKMRQACRTSGFGNGGHGVGDRFPGRGRNRDGLIAGARIGIKDGLLDIGRLDLVGKDDVGTLEDAAGGDAGDGTNKLDGGDRDGSLADANGGDFARVPLLMVVPHLPFRRGHRAAGFVRKIDSGLPADAKAAGPIGDLFDAEAGGECVVEDVAGPRDGVVDVDHAVGTVVRGDPAALVGAK